MENKFNNRNMQTAPTKQGNASVQSSSYGKNRFSTARRRPKRGAKEKSEFESQLLDIARVTRVTKGGKRFSFRATVVIGDRKGMVGVGVAQGHDVAQSMQKAIQRARKEAIRVPIVNSTIAHEVICSYHGAKVLIKPASAGRGIKAGGPVRVVAQLAGIDNITAKLIKRTNNKINIARAALRALSLLKRKAGAEGNAGIKANINKK